MTSQPSIRLATPRDLGELTRLEQIAFTADRFTESQIEYLITRAHATILIMETADGVAGSAYLLWRKNLPLARLYNIAINPKFQGQGLGAKLLAECELEAARRRCTVMSLEVRFDNRQAIVFYERHGFSVTEEMPDYYEDGSTGLKMTKPLTVRVSPGLRIKVPYYAQTLDFTCGPASLMMAFKHFVPDITFDRAMEFSLWKEATLVFMTSGLGGCDPFGLALASRRRGFQTRVILSKEKSPFFSSVRLESKREVIRAVGFERKDDRHGSSGGVLRFPLRGNRRRHLSQSRPGGAYQHLSSHRRPRSSLGGGDRLQQEVCLLQRSRSGKLRQRPPPRPQRAGADRGV